MTSKAQARIRSEARGVDALLEEIPESDWVNRASMEARKAALDQERLATEAAEALAPPAETATITFRGRPVHESDGIRADFASHAMKSLNKVFGALAKQFRGELANAGESPIPALMIVGTAQGSFGFELEEANTEQTGSVLSATSRLLEATKSDESFAAALQDSDPEVLKYFAQFVRTLKGGGATVRLAGRDWAGAIENEDDVDGALRRIGSIKDEEEREIAGTLAGLLPDDRRFEFVPDGGREILKGGVPAGVFRRVGDAMLSGVRRHGKATFVVRSFEQPWSDQPRRTFAMIRFVADP